MIKNYEIKNDLIKIRIISGIVGFVFTALFVTNISNSSISAELMGLFIALGASGVFFATPTIQTIKSENSYLKYLENFTLEELNKAITDDKNDYETKIQIKNYCENITPKYLNLKNNSCCNCKEEDK